MAVHIDQLTSEVIPEPESGPVTAGAEPAEWWEELDRASNAAARLARDYRRTCAEGFDD